MTEPAALRPLRERIPAPPEVRLPDALDGVTWRPATSDDAPAITGLL